MKEAPRSLYETEQKPGKLRNVAIECFRSLEPKSPTGLAPTISLSTTTALGNQIDFHLMFLGNPYELSHNIEELSSFYITVSKTETEKSRFKKDRKITSSLNIDLDRKLKVTANGASIEIASTDPLLDNIADLLKKALEEELPRAKERKQQAEEKAKGDNIILTEQLRSIAS